MQAVSAEMFSGDQGQKLVDETLSELNTTGLANEQQSAAARLAAVRRASSTTSLSSPPSNRPAVPAPRGITMPYTVS